MSCFGCCVRAGENKRYNGYLDTVKPRIVAIFTRNGDGSQEQGTGIMISDNLVLTSHTGLPRSEAAEGGMISLRHAGANCRSPNLWPPVSTMLRKLLPQRLFVTSQSLGLSIVACEPIIPNINPENYELLKASDDKLSVGTSVYVLGQVQNEEGEGLLMFGEGVVTKEDEQVIEFYSSDGYFWAPGSAGFDAKGAFAFVVAGRRPYSRDCPLRKRWSHARNSTQHGILIHAVRDWTRDAWTGEFGTLRQLYQFCPTKVENPVNAFLCENPDGAQERLIQETVEDIRKDDNLPMSRSRKVKPNLESIGFIHQATDSRSSSASSNVRDIPVHCTSIPQSLSLKERTPEMNARIDGRNLKPQSSHDLSGLAALAADELEGYDEQRTQSANEETEPPLPSQTIPVGNVLNHQTGSKVPGETPLLGQKKKGRARRRWWYPSRWSKARPRTAEGRGGTGGIHLGDTTSEEQAEREDLEATSKEDLGNDYVELNFSVSRSSPRVRSPGSATEEHSHLMTGSEDKRDFPFVSRQNENFRGTCPSQKVPRVLDDNSERNRNLYNPSSIPTRYCNGDYTSDGSEEDEQGRSTPRLRPPEVLAGVDGLHLSAKQVEEAKVPESSSWEPNRICTSPDAENSGVVTLLDYRSFDAAELKGRTSDRTTVDIENPSNGPTKCTCFQTWPKLVTRKNKVVVESMGLFSTQTISIPSTRSASSIKGPLTPQEAPDSPPEGMCSPGRTSPPVSLELLDYAAIMAIESASARFLEPRSSTCGAGKCVADNQLPYSCSPTDQTQPETASCVDN